MRVRYGWTAAIGMSSFASPALAKVDTSLAQTEFDPLNHLLVNAHGQSDSVTDFDGEGLLTVPPTDEQEMAFGSTGWDAMIYKLSDSDSPDGAHLVQPQVPRDRDFLPELKAFSLAANHASTGLTSPDSDINGGESASAAPTSAFEISATLTVASDYRFRGISLSDRDPAVQGSIDFEHDSGVYAGIWGSNIAEFAGAHSELDVYGGWRGEFGPLAVDAGITGYFYPGGRGADYYEVTGSASYSYGPAEAKLGIAYAPDQANLGGDDSVYMYGQIKAALPATPVTLVAQVGREEGALEGVVGAKWDWSLGAQIVKDRFTLGLTYVDTNADRSQDPDKIAHAGLILSLSIAI